MDNLAYNIISEEIYFLPDDALDKLQEELYNIRAARYARDEIATAKTQLNEEKIHD